MKKITFLLSAFCFLLPASSLFAQQPQFPDSGFETGWVNKNGVYGAYVEYLTDFFYTLNSLYAIENEPKPADITAYRDPNGQSGNCIKLVSGVIPVGSKNIFLPGMVGTIDQNFVDQFLNNGGQITVSKDWLGNETPHALEGWYKYNPVSGDSALIDIGFHNWDGEVFVEKLIITKPIGAWTHFTINIPEKYWKEDFTEIRTMFVASAGVNFDELQECKGQKESTLWIDNISLNYNLGIKQNLLSSLKVNTFPNPATEVLNVELNENFTGKIIVYDLSGKIVAEDNINGTQSQLNISTFSTGNYIYRLMKENTIFAQGKFVVTK
ncbi:MAG: T9SS type A sorting domain-containing protein [Bacteroidetes bacterium]|nr:T9SS type A sorting domain-containing protein [Bacteroidota bacterium]MCL1969102.1 T9SS type A sorting domain-containing protein [Bacteroidota bacterium]